MQGYYAAKSSEEENTDSDFDQLVNRIKNSPKILYTAERHLRFLQKKMKNIEFSAQDIGSIISTWENNYALIKGVIKENPQLSTI